MQFSCEHFSTFLHLQNRRFGSFFCFMFSGKKKYLPIQGRYLSLVNLESRKKTKLDIKIFFKQVYTVHVYTLLGFIIRLHHCCAFLRVYFVFAHAHKEVCLCKFDAWFNSLYIFVKIILSEYFCVELSPFSGNNWQKKIYLCINNISPNTIQ